MMVSSFVKQLSASHVFRIVAPLLSTLDLRIAWVVTVGVLFDVTGDWIGRVRLALADFILVLFAFNMLSQRRLPMVGSLRGLPYWQWLVALVVLVIVTGSLVVRLRLGYLPQWTVVNKDIAMVVMLGSYFFIASAPSRPHLVSDLLNWLIISASLLNIVALAGAAVRYIWDIPNSLMDDGGTTLRLSGTMINSNGYGGYLAAVLSVQLSAFVTKERMFGIPRWIQGANCVALLLGILLTISRGSWFAALGGALTVMMVTSVMRHHWCLSVRNLIAPALVSTALFAVLALTGMGGLTTAVRDYTAPQRLESSPWLYTPIGPPSVAEFLRIASNPSGAAARIAINQTAIGMYLESPWSVLFGIGVGSFLEESEKTALQRRMLIHSVYLWVLVELGLLGFAVLSGLLLSMVGGLWACLRSANAPDYAAVALLAALGAVLVRFLSSEMLSQRYVWLILAVASLLVRVRSLSSPLGNAGVVEAGRGI